MSLVKYNNGILGHLFGDLLRHLRVEQIMERINDNIYKRHLHLVGQFDAGHTLFKDKSYHSSNSEIRADSFITPELQDICQGPYSRWYQLPGFSLSQCLQYVLDSSKETRKMNTSCQSQSSTDPGFARPFSQAEELVKSRQRASTTLPFFSFATYVKFI